MKLDRTKLLQRQDSVRDARLYIIATEGEKTEGQYFTIFQSPRVKVRVIPTGPDGKSSPAHVFDRLSLFHDEYNLGPEDKLWLMIDVDRWSLENLATVCKQANQMNIGLAVSNPCFELWLWLHHGDCEVSDTDCRAIESRLRSQLGSYSKKNLDIDAYKPYIRQAIQRAKNLDSAPNELWPSFPGTHVYKVVKSLLD
ncbi:MAG TPA: RloB family protein [Chthonomonadaceae bacterium]|nr:RloB family protein [Chthonomonadaceae bacterium]